MTTKWVKIAHISDSHIGYEAYKKLSTKGTNQREEDVARAFARCVDQILDEDPPLVVHSGDIADRPGVQIRQILFIKQQLTKLCSLRKDGSRRQVVVISGNHDQPSNRKEACFLELFREIPGLHIVTNKYEVIEFNDIYHNASEELRDVVVHALPHDILKSVDFAEVNPLLNKINILTSHGVAGGSELYVKSLGREFAVPTEVLAKDWEYVALGHWHKQGPVSIMGSNVVGNTRKSKVWYAGSTENMGFGDLLDGGENRGWLSVKVALGDFPKIEKKNIEIRKIIRLQEVNADGCSVNDIFEKIKSNLNSVELNGAVVGQVIREISRENWALLGISLLKEIGKDALYFEITPKFKAVKAMSTNFSGRSTMEDLLKKAAEAEISEEDRAESVKFALELITDARRKSLSRDANKDSINDNLNSETYEVV